MALPTITIDIIRHAEAQHNILGSHIRDPPLTAAGRAQSRELARGFPYSRQVARVVASPLRRTIETATVAFADSVLRAPSSPGRQKQQKKQQKKPKKILLLPELQEVNPYPSSTGSSPDALSAACGNELVDWTGLDPQWFLKGPDTDFAPIPEKVEERARRARVYLRELARTVVGERNNNNNNNNNNDDDKDGGGGGSSSSSHDTNDGDGDDSNGPHIVVVTHGEFAHWLTGDFVGVDHRHNTGWWNAEFRSYRFAGPPDLHEGDTEAALVETARSRDMRRAYSFSAEKPPTLAENASFKAVATKRVLAYAAVQEEEEWEDVDADVRNEVGEVVQSEEEREVVVVGR